MARSSRVLLAGLVACGVAVALFAALFARDGSDDYAGWSLAVALLAAPACAVIVRDRERLGPVAAAAFALPAGAALGGLILLPVLSLPGRVGGDVWTQTIAPVLAGPIAMAVCATLVWLRLRGQPTRAGARRVLAVVGGSGAFALLATAPLWWGFWSAIGLDQAMQVALLLLAALPLGWALFPALMLAATADR